ncbi:hypothetical protein JI752_018780 [Lysobacter sp. MMG2]|uniref:hypothetical protein n=1 Tax=Lysobacter sp. MMG2 TaxID=2801338 RepID=UPI001C249739|nr:hypothetical protein [Lysobacter sp. MMG2]MBU8978198.1 hypothetical protein [Lysobacter sp. MMG2]
MLTLLRTRRQRAELESAARYLGPIRRMVRTAALVAPPRPWRAAGVFAVPALEAVGFDRNSELLLVVSGEGRGVIDCSTGEKIARKHGTLEGEPSAGPLQAVGIGPLDGQLIATAGRQGGGLMRVTPDGWALEIVTLDWPRAEILLVPPRASLFACHEDAEASFSRIESHPELHACGFSFSGRSLVIAVGDDLAIYCRD